VTVERQAQALLDVVDADRAQKCEAILAAAREQADAIVRQAHVDARSRLRAAFGEERERHAARVRAARANLQTRRRHASQQRAAALLAAGWVRLPDELVRRWQTEPARRSWVAAVIARARALLPSGTWRIVHAPDWPIAERDALVADIAATLGAAPTCETATAVRAGIRAYGNGNVIDGTLEGLLADRADIGGRLLQLLELESEAANRATSPAGVRATSPVRVGS
jgi:hypothetical protein